MNNTEKIFKDRLIENYLSKFTRADDIYNQTQESNSVLDASGAGGALGFFSKSANSAVFDIYKIPHGTIEKIMD